MIQFCRRLVRNGPTTAGAALWIVLITLAPAGCADEEEAVKAAPAGARAGDERWVVYFKEGAADLSAYHAALAAGEDTAEIEETLRKQAKTRRKTFAKTLQSLDGKIVSYWYLTNAVTVEIPAGVVETLRTESSVARMEPDTLLE